jgi:hypothetical protein
MMVIRNEADRYLNECLAHLLEFCDEIRILDDGSEDDWSFGWEQEERIVVETKPFSTFFQHEGNTRQALLEHAMRGMPTHLLALDGDEFIADGQKLRAALEAGPPNGICKLSMTEVWGADEQGLNVRVDGKWPPRPVGMAFAVPQDHHVDRQKRRHWRIPPSAGACGRVPILTQAASNRTQAPPTTDVLHFGWACKADRPARYARYSHDGFGHDMRHIHSIMWGDEQVQIRKMPWPEALDKKTLLARVNRT